MYIVGIDPGLKGGVAMRQIEVEPLTDIACTFPMPLTAEGIIDCIAIREAVNHYLAPASVPTIYLEVVHAMPKQGVTSMFTFGKGYGQIIGMCQVLAWPLCYVRPQQWQKYLRGRHPEIVLGSDKWTKDTSVLVCDRLFPEVNLMASRRCHKPHDGMADALCIAQYGIMIETDGGRDDAINRIARR